MIERAVGLLMGRDGLEQPEAFNRLRQAARSAGREVGDVARELLSGDLGPMAPERLT